MNAGVSNPFQSSFEGETYESSADNNTSNNSDSDYCFMCETETRIFIQKKTEILVAGKEQEQIPAWYYLVLYHVLACSPISDRRLHFALLNAEAH